MANHPPRPSKRESTRTIVITQGATDLRAWRDTQGVSIDVLRERLEARGVVVTRQTISRWETGESLPEPDRIPHLTAITGIPGERFLHPSTRKLVEQLAKKAAA